MKLTRFEKRFFVPDLDVTVFSGLHKGLVTRKEGSAVAVAVTIMITVQSRVSGEREPCGWSRQLRASAI